MSIASSISFPDLSRKLRWGELELLTKNPKNNKAP